MSVIGEVSVVKEVDQLTVVCSYACTFDKILSVGVTSSSHKTYLKLTFDEPVGRMWQVLAYEYCIVQSLSSNKFLKMVSLYTQLWDNLTLWEGVFEDINLSVNRVGTTTRVRFQPDDADFVVFAYDDELHFIGRTPLGSADRFPDRKWTDDFFAPCCVERRDQHYYFVPELKEVIDQQEVTLVPLLSLGKLSFRDCVTKC